MRIEVERLTEAGQAFAHTYGPGDLDVGDERVRLAGPARVEGRASRKGEEVNVRGTLRADLVAPCDRCLRPVALPVEAEFDLDYLPREAESRAGEETELLREDLDASVYEGEHLDVDDLVREQLLLALPTRLRCGEECRGLCPTCGADLNTETCACAEKEVDPRWAALAGWKQERG